MSLTTRLDHASPAPLLHWLPSGSEVTAVRQIDGLHGAELHMCLAAVHVERPDPDHPLRPQLGYLRGGELVFRQPVVQQQTPGCIGRITQARVRLADRPDWLPRLAWPLALEGALVVELHFAHGALLSLTATGLHGGSSDGGAEFLESLAC
ncbi:MAG: hypothetical protein RLY71_3136 [Pseudomonadota bacterium]|jgi:hypothetical protein